MEMYVKVVLKNVTWNRKARLNSSPHYFGFRMTDHYKPLALLFSPVEMTTALISRNTEI